MEIQKVFKILPPISLSLQRCSSIRINIEKEIKFINNNKQEQVTTTFLLNTELFLKWLHIPQSNKKESSI